MGGRSGIDAELSRRIVGAWICPCLGFRCCRRPAHGLQRSPRCCLVFVYLFLLLRATALPAHGDVERNPGPSAQPRASSSHDHGVLDGKRQLSASDTLNAPHRNGGLYVFQRP